MIHREDLVKIGRFNKPHGIRGELSFSLTGRWCDDAENPFFICELDGIFVPFRLEEYRFTSGSAALIRLKTIDSDRKARRLANHEVYFPKNQIPASPEDELYAWDYLPGFTETDEKMGKIGIISEIDDSTLNTLFIVQRGEEEVLIPAVEEMISRVDEAGQTIYVILPEGLIELDR
jgi:16S rRNA processing protein RimM